MGRVERTSENVQATVMAPVRKVNALFAGISAALDHLRGVDRPEGSPRHWGNGDFIG